MDDRDLTPGELATIEKTWRSDESLTKIESNWNAFQKWCNLLGDRAPNVNKMLESFANKACLAPASSKFEFHNAFPGGFIDHSLRVLDKAVNLAAAWKVKLPKEKLIMAALFHDWGKVGTLENDYYIKQDKEWYRLRGQTFIRNNKIKMSNAELGLYTLSQFDIKLSEDEYVAILINDGQYVDANKHYAMKEPALALIIHFADRWATECEKNRTSLLDSDAVKI